MVHKERGVSSCRYEAVCAKVTAYLLREGGVVNPMFFARTLDRLCRCSILGYPTWLVSKH